MALYAIPFNQAVARANFLTLREDVVQERPLAHQAETAALFQLSQVLAVAVSLAAPLFLASSWLHYATFCGFLAFNLFTNIWSSEVQMTMFAVDRPLAYEWATLVRRLANFAALVWLLVSKDFLSFNLVVLVQAILAHAWAVRAMRRHGDLFGRPRGLSSGRLRAHLLKLWTSIQATFGEWVTFNAPYAIFTLRYGVGPPLVALDAAMKLMRIVLAVTRNLCEMALPKLSRDIVGGRTWPALRLAAAMLGICTLGGAMLAGGVLLREQQVFSLLLGPNNVVPPGAGGPVAVAMLTGVGFQVGSMIVGFFAQRQIVRGFSVLVMLSCAALASAVFVLKPAPLQALWFLALSLAASACVALAAMFLTLRGFTRTPQAADGGPA